MTMKQLLGGAAVAALLAGAAQAQVASVAPASQFLPANVIANEGGQDQTGNLAIQFDIASAFAAMGAGGVIDLTITVNDAVFSGVVPPGALANTGGGADCAFLVDPQLGGGAGGNSVTFRSSGQLNNCGVGGLITVTLPISVDFGDQVSVSARFEATADAGGYGPIVNRSIVGDDIMLYGDALSYSIAAGAAANGELDTDGEDFADLLNLTNGLIGTLSTSYDDTLFYTPGVDLNTATIPAEDLAADGDLTVTFTDVFGIATLSLDGNGCGAAVGNVFTCAVDTSNTASQDIVFTLVGNPDGTVTQTPTAALSLTADAGANAGADVFDGLAATALTTIQLDNGRAVTAITNSNFPWVRISPANGGTESNFRISLASNAEANAVEFVRVSIAAGNGLAAQTIELEEAAIGSGFRIQGSTVTFNSRDLGSEAVGSGNADIISVSLDHNETALTPVNAAARPILRQLVNRDPSNLVATPGLASDN